MSDIINNAFRMRLHINRACILHLSAYIINGPLFKIYIKIHYVQNFKKGTYIHVFIYIIVPIAFSIGNVDIRNHVEVI